MAALQPIGKTDSLKVCVEGPFGHRFICQGSEDFIRYLVSAANHTLGPVRRLWIPEEQYFEMIGLRIFIDAAFGNVDIAEGFQIDG